MKSFEGLKNIASEILGTPLQEIDESISRENLPEWDSFNHLMLMAEVEKRFNISFTVDEINSIEDFDALWQLISKKSGCASNAD
jgi:acyl carrier protein